MATTVRNVLDEARNTLYRGHRDERNRLTSSLAAGATTATVDFSTKGIQAGAKLSIDLEDIHVWAVTGQNPTSIQRGQFGSTDATHAAGSIVTVNPIVSDYELFVALNDELASLSGEGLFKVVVKNITASSSVTGYDLAADVLDVLDVRWKNQGSSKNWPSLRSFAVARNLPTTDFASGVALLLYESIPAGQTIAVQYRGSFTAVAALTDNVATVSGIHAEAIPLLVVGTALRVAQGRPMRRSQVDAQGSGRRAEEVSVNDTLAAAGGLRQLRRDLINAEQARLAARYPVTIR